MLEPHHQAMLTGEYGPGRRKAMEILATLARIFGAERMIDVTSAQVAGVSYGNIGEAGLSFLCDWAAMGDRAKIPAFMNPAALDRALWHKLGMPQERVAKQNKIIECLQKLGIEPTLTCTPYHTAVNPKPGEHLAWSESSAVVFANSVLGARTNREGGPSALAAALTGCTPYYGLHCDENRRAQVRFTITCRLDDAADYAALGIHIGRTAGAKIPWLEGLELPDDELTRLSCLKALGAAMGASGAIGLFHLAGYTPEANAQPTQLQAIIKDHFTVTSIANIKKQLNTSDKPIDLVAIGCPHLSYAEIKAVFSRLSGKTIKIPVWLTTSEATRERLNQEGMVEEFERIGARIVADTCVVVTHLKEMGYKVIATDSGKAASYLPAHQGVDVRFGSIEQCLSAAVNGVWNQ